jgi:hypothetical protein
MCRRLHGRVPRPQTPGSPRQRAPRSRSSSLPRWTSSRRPRKRRPPRRRLSQSSRSSTPGVCSWPRQHWTTASAAARLLCAGGDYRRARRCQRGQRGRADRAPARARQGRPTETTERAREGEPIDLLLGTLAGAAIALLAGLERERLRVCRAPSCGMYSEPLAAACSTWAKDAAAARLAETERARPDTVGAQELTRHHCRDGLSPNGG